MPGVRGAGLLAHGFDYGGGDIGTAMDLSAVREDLLVPDDPEIERVKDEKTLAACQNTVARGFGEDPAETEGSTRCTAG